MSFCAFVDVVVVCCMSVVVDSDVTIRARVRSLSYSPSGKEKYPRIPYISALAFAHASLLLLTKNSMLLSPSVNSFGDKIPLKVILPLPALPPTDVAMVTLVKPIGPWISACGKSSDPNVRAPGNHSA